MMRKVSWVVRAKLNFNYNAFRSTIVKDLNDAQPGYVVAFLITISAFATMSG